jgi:uncharacterized protein (TIGR00255 family)
MIKSMTGYGLATTEYENKKINVEIRSLNSKFLELLVKLPKIYNDKENVLRTICGKQIERGKASVILVIENTSEEVTGNATLNIPLFKTYYGQLSDLAKSLNADQANIFQETLKISEVWNTKQAEVNEQEWEVINTTFLKALTAFNAFRIDEGKVLANDMSARVKLINDSILAVEKLEVARVPAIKEKIEQLLKDTVGAINIDQNRLEQELIFYAEKYDITEEKTRLRSHCDYFLSIMQEAESNGKKLGFIAQEIGREINTMGSKANDANIQKIVVGMKDELEKIKEQLLNIL